MLFPAKTFLLGEYAALIGGSALLLTNRPCFSLELKDSNSSFLEGIHKDSPAGQLWAEYSLKKTALWHDPYKGIGGFGASGAQFLAVYKALGLEFTIEAVLEKYFSFLPAINRPSGYDLIAQMQQQCVFINKEQTQIKTITWDFQDLSFIIAHTGKKLITHEHLDVQNLLDKFIELSKLADLGFEALQTKDLNLLCSVVNHYYDWLLEHKLVAKHTENIINSLKLIPQILACKGCGAMGADTLIVLCKPSDKNFVIEQLKHLRLLVIADEDSLFTLF